MDLHFEWDVKKAQQNLQKHGVSFEEAQTVFLDESAIIQGARDEEGIRPRKNEESLKSIRKAAEKANDHPSRPGDNRILQRNGV